MGLVGGVVKPSSTIFDNRKLRKFQILNRTAWSYAAVETHIFVS